MSDAPLVVHLDGRSVTVTVRRSARASQLALRLDAVRGPVLVLPSNVGRRHAQNFLARHAQWLMEKMEALPVAPSLAAGQSIPILGNPHAICHQPGARRGVWHGDGHIHVSGQAEHLPRRLLDYLKKLARSQISARVQHGASRLGVTVSRITIKDTRSRWGSCTQDGSLSFSWRLIMAPDWVLDYVVAHELSHLLHMDHSPAFWATVARLNPHARAAREWLKSHGQALHLVGR